MSLKDGDREILLQKLRQQYDDGSRDWNDVPRAKKH